ncbi:MAG: hypothetical protein RLW87_23070 [Alphaproteobacteria bacterium]
MAITSPRDSGMGESVCSTFIPFLRAKPFRIYGVDHEQALELSHRLIESMIAAQDFEVVDGDGVPVALPPLP